MSAARGTMNIRAYRQLLSRTLPHVIHTEEENEAYIAQLEALHDQGNLTPEQEELADLLTLLIEDFENQHYSLEAATPLDVLRELMEANDLSQADLIDAFGARSTVSEVLSGKRELSKTHIQNLSRRFNVSPGVFFPLEDIAG
ncbi:MAG: helix-turn-helix domain-containing protein [Acidobacteriaceae bacterium]|nr:helix-turn-helix domain-containing protein [Acidobacteriaceae bacterium]MBV9295985.1 helix-turn-helix domain-containing protein [Acidobacteriaceae bacterium]MBV9766648.1 helix-turn-helix domain-containing protein [Acidobacteriaceae bacterium]